MRVMAIDHQALTLWRERSGFTKVDFAKKCGISLQYLCDIEAGNRKLKRSPDLVKRFAKELGIPAIYLEHREAVAK